MKREMLLILVFAFLAIVPFVYAENSNISVEDFKSNLSNHIEVYNNNSQNLPSAIKYLFGNERINVYLDNSVFYGVVSVDGKIVESNESGIDNPSMNVYMAESTLKGMLGGEIGVEGEREHI